MVLIYFRGLKPSFAQKSDAFKLRFFNTNGYLGFNPGLITIWPKAKASVSFGIVLTEGYPESFRGFRKNPKAKALDFM